MTWNDIVQLISSVGFPIVACVYLAYTNNATLDKFRESLDANTDLLQQLTIFITKKIDNGGGKEHDD